MQRYAVKFWFKLRESALGTLKLIKQVYMDVALSDTIVFESRKIFKKGREFVKNEHRAGRPN